MAMVKGGGGLGSSGSDDGEAGQGASKRLGGDCEAILLFSALLVGGWC